jgi:Domain of unknown function (DUF4390)
MALDRCGNVERGGGELAGPRPSRSPCAARGRWLIGALLFLSQPLAAQDTSAVRLEVALAPTSRDPTVFTRNLLEETPWLSTLRQGLPLRLQYRLEIWRSREAWLDDVVRQLEWTIVVRHEPLLDQFTVTRLGPFKGIQTRTLGTAGALAAQLGLGLRFPVAPTEPGRYYYAASLSVATLSDSDLDKFERVLRGEIDQGTSEGGGIAERARRLVLQLAGLPTAKLSAQSEQFDVAR